MPRDLRRGHHFGVFALVSLSSLPDVSPDGCCRLLWEKLPTYLRTCIRWWLLECCRENACSREGRRDCAGSQLGSRPAGRLKRFGA